MSGWDLHGTTSLFCSHRTWEPQFSDLHTVVMISTLKATNLLVPRDLANSKTWHATHISCLLHVPSFTWNCSPVCLLIMTTQKPYKGKSIQCFLSCRDFSSAISLCPLVPPGGDWGRGLYSHGILTLPHNGPLSSCFWISHCTLPGCWHAIINKYLCGKRLLWKCLGEVWGYLASVDKVDFMIYFQTFHQQ